MHAAAAARAVGPATRRLSKLLNRLRIFSYDGRLTRPTRVTPMKVLSSLKSAKSRHRDCKVVRRRGKVFVICKSNPRFKARQR